MKKISELALFVRYNKYRRKLKRLVLMNKNTHRQRVLRKHLERLYKQLSATNFGVKQKALLAASFAAVMSLGMSSATAQTEFQENAINQFGLEPFPGPNFVYASIAHADLDNDGDLDLLSGHYDGNFRYFENVGTATAPDYTSPTQNPFSLTDPGGYTVIATVDIDNDGDMDVMVNQYGNGASFKFYENIGTASAPLFAAAVSSPFGLPPTGYAGSMDFVDIDGDNDLDFFTFNGGAAMLYENTGTISNPVFGAGQSDPFSFSVSPYQGRFVDIDNDGDYDLLGSTTSFAYFENTGTPQAAVFAPVSYNPFFLRTLFNNIYGLDVLDMDGDNDFDVVYNNSVTGDFHYFQNIGTNSSPSFTDGHSNLFSLHITSGSVDPTFGDLDGDGDLDLFSEDNGYFDFFENIGTVNAPEFAPTQTNPFGLTSYLGNSPTLVDIDGDGDLDIMNSYNTNFNFIENIGTNTSPIFTAPQFAPFSIPSTFSDISADFADLDNDGDFDILAQISIYGTIYFFENVGSATNPTFTTPVLDPFSLGANSQRRDPHLGDLDNDGDLDLLFGNPFTSGFTFYENIGTASAPNFGAPQENPFALREVAYDANNQFQVMPAMVDLNNDGDLDVMAGAQYRGLVYFDNISGCSVNPTTSLVDFTITANQAGAQSYQWVDCNNGNAPITGATGQSFTATANGSYACEITLPNCSEITNCVTITTIGLEENTAQAIRIYPNPATTTIHIEADQPIQSVTLFNALGNLVDQFEGDEYTVLDLQPGIYIISVKTADGIHQSKFVKQ